MGMYKIFRPIIFLLDAEKAHNLAINFLRLFPNLANIFSHKRRYKNLEKEVCGLKFKSPIGLAAGFDKNGQVVKAMSGFGFGFVEVGTVTPRPQSGNEKPRIFRLQKDRAIINRLGFNNKGADQLERNLARFDFAKSGDKKTTNNIICGINIGKNKDSQSNVGDYLNLLERFYQKASYITVNISSPNTKNLRDIQKADYLDDFLSQIMAKKQELHKKFDGETPIFLKVAPDLQDEEIAQIAAAILKNKVDGIIVSNTTIDRELDLKSSDRQQGGGLSGKPLFDKSNIVLQKFSDILQGKVAIIAVGGVSSVNDVIKKINCGADLVQIYSALIYEGPGLAEKINCQLSRAVAK